MNKTRYFIEIAYNGTKFHGWQIQPNATSVQECLDKALSTYFRHTVTTVGCGRTDTGVHATQFYAHFDLEQSALQPQQISKAITGVNSLLPYEISVISLFDVAPNAHARFDATARTYHYHLHFHKDPFKLDRSWLFKGDLNLAKMNEAAQILLHHTDFSCFSKSHTQTFTNNCKVTEAHFKQTEKGLQFTISADRFLRNMVRAIVGTLVRVGQAELTLSNFEQIIISKNRSNAGQSVPACGLYLVNIIYPYIKQDA